MSKRLKSMMSAMGTSSFDVLPDIPTLKGSREISIKLDDLNSVESAVRQFVLSGKKVFDPINFTIRDNSSEKQPLLRASLESGKGVVVRDASGKEYLTVTLPTKSTNVAGKIVNPVGNTVYKICLTSDAHTLELENVAASSKSSPTLTIKKMDDPVEKMRSRFITTPNQFDKFAYKLKSDGKTAARIWPRPQSHINTYNVEFVSDSCREIAISVALLLTLTVAFQPLQNLLKESASGV